MFCSEAAIRTIAVTEYSDVSHILDFFIELKRGVGIAIKSKETSS